MCIRDSLKCDPYKKCFNPCERFTCGDNAKCVVNKTSREPSCKCNDGKYRGNPNVECRPFECLKPSDCPANQTCSNANEKCINPCELSSPCASSNYCIVKEHTPLCKCPRDSFGDPYKGACEKYQCNNVTKCPSFLACRSGICEGIKYNSTTFCRN